MLHMMMASLTSYYGNYNIDVYSTLCVQKSIVDWKLYTESLTFFVAHHKNATSINMCPFICSMCGAHERTLAVCPHVSPIIILQHSLHSCTIASAHSKTITVCARVASPQRST